MDDRKVPISFRTRSLISFEDFLANADTKQLRVIMPSWMDGGADFVFRGVCIELKWSRFLEGSLTLKHLLYLYYHHIFGIRTYAISTDIKTKEERWTIIDERERLFRGIPDILATEDPYAPKSVKISDRETMFPIRVWQENEDFFKEIKVILGEFSPNKEYDRMEVEEEKAELSLQNGEIFEYFLSASKCGYSSSFSDIRKHLAERWLDDGAPEEVLKRRIAFVDRFLSSIIQ